MVRRVGKPAKQGPYVQAPRRSPPKVVRGDSLFVGVGDGAGAARTDLDSPSGKVLRMTLDAKPFDDNPFAATARPGSARGYVWAYGLRNPFGLAAVGDEIFATHNGNAIDSLPAHRAGRRLPLERLRFDDRRECRGRHDTRCRPGPPRLLRRA